MLAVHHTINHSCEPNAECVMLSSAQQCRIAVRSVKMVSKGEQIFISYVKEEENSKDVYERYWRLLWDYSFECDCSRCQCEMTDEMK